MNHICFDPNEKLTFCSAGRFISKTPSVHPRRTLDTAVLLFGYSGEYPIMQDGVEHILRKGCFRILFPGHEHYGTSPSSPGQSHFWCHFYLPESYRLLSDTEICDSNTSLCIIPEYAAPADSEKYYVLFSQMIDEAEKLPDDSKISNAVCDAYIKIILCGLANDPKNTLYATVRASMNVEVKKDDDGTNYAHVTFNNTNNNVLFDCHGLPKYSLESGVVYYKALIRTNVTGKTPHITVYNMADKEGTKVGNGVAGSAPNALAGNGQWEEVIVKVTDFPAGAVTSTQIHFFPFGNCKGENLFKDGKLVVDNAYLDVAAWAAFQNLASAEAFDIKAAAKK